MSLKIVFMGTPEFSVHSLEAINKSKHKILSIFTQPPQKKLRGQKILPSPVQKAAERLKIPFRTPKNLNSQEDYQFLKSLSPDVVVVVAYGKIIPDKILKIPNILFLNLHASLLPKWRGAAPMERAILNQDKKIGFSIMKIVSELDAGPYMKQTSFTLNKKMNLGELNKKISLEGAKGLVESLDKISTNDFKFDDQDNSKATYAKKIDKKETQINWNNKADEIIAQVNAFNPNPGAWFIFNNNRIKILKAIEVEGSDTPGVVINDELTIACQQNAIKVLLIQKEGKKILETKNFLAGNKIKKGTKLI